jgi:hypothetical protein
MLPNGPDLTPTTICNPLSEDFTTTFAEERTPTTYTLHSKEVAEYPKWLADHIGKQLVRKIALMASPQISWDIREEEARKQVFVTL